MANINVLDKSIFNRIAAGEVVERPASVVKELVENSIDAGATSISIEIEDGGIAKIKVSDNGCGMTKENLEKCILPHATSKITTVDDLERIGTLGFRGEALSSICACAKVCIISKTENEEIGHKLVCNGGEVESLTEVGTITGTTVIVENLFYCIPARAKFLKKPKQEESEITNIVSRLILANPEVSIKYAANGKTIFHSAGTGLKDAIFCVYNKETVDNIIPLEFENSLIKVSGFISKPSFTKANRTYQTLIINKRYVINYSISSAIQKAYEHFLMKNNFPFYVIHMQIALDKIDVNVHPTKLEVKFEDGGRIYAMFLNAVSDVLFNVNTLKEFKNFKTETREETNSCTTSEMPLFTLKENEGKNYEEKQDDVNNFVYKLDDDFVSTETNKKIGNAHAEISEYIMDDVSSNENLLFQCDNGFTYKLAETMVESNPNFKENLETKTEVTQNTFNLGESYKLIGTIFNTYILVEQNDNVLIIDQHAAHERILFDKFMQESENSSIAIQPLLVPYILDTNYQETAFINENINEFKNLGFDMEEFGTNCFKISSVPLILKNISFKSFFNDVLKDLNNNLNLKKTDLIYNFIAKQACKNAVKANDILSNNEIKTLINKINNETSVLLCPHGRPIAINLSKTEIEKMFKRIV